MFITLTNLTEMGLCQCQSWNEASVCLGFYLICMYSVFVWVSVLSVCIVSLSGFLSYLCVYIVSLGFYLICVYSVFVWVSVLSVCIVSMSVSIVSMSGFLSYLCV